jgi:hypothetical protein
MMARPSARARGYTSEWDIRARRFRNVDDAHRHSRKSSTARLSTGWNRSVTSNTASEWFGEQILWPRWRSSTSASAMSNGRSSAGGESR